MTDVLHLCLSGGKGIFVSVRIGHSIGEGSEYRIPYLQLDGLILRTVRLCQNVQADHVFVDPFLAVDGLDEDTFLYNEEAILGYRLRAKGYRGVVLDVPVIHDEKRDKAVGWKKQWRTGKLTRASARVYMRKYLGCGPFTLAVYTAMSAIGCVERYLISWVLR